MNPLLEVRNLILEYGTERGVLRAVDNVSFSVGNGQALGVVGESGSGKSLAMKSVLGIIDFAPGIVNGNIRIYKDGDYTEIIKDMAPNKKCNVTLSGQSRVLFTEYFNISSSEQTIKLAHKPVTSSLLIYHFNSKLHSLEVVDYELLNVSSETLMKLNIPVNHEKNLFIQILHFQLV